MQRGPESWYNKPSQNSFVNMEGIFKELADQKCLVSVLLRTLQLSSESICITDLQGNIRFCNTRCQNLFQMCGIEPLSNSQSGNSTSEYRFTNSNFYEMISKPSESEFSHLKYLEEFSAQVTLKSNTIVVEGSRHISRDPQSDSSFIIHKITIQNEEKEKFAQCYKEMIDCSETGIGLWKQENGTLEMKDKKEYPVFTLVHANSRCLTILESFPHIKVGKSLHQIFAGSSLQMLSESFLESCNTPQIFPRFCLNETLLKLKLSPLSHGYYLMNIEFSDKVNGTNHSPKKDQIKPIETIQLLPPQVFNAIREPSTTTASYRVVKRDGVFSMPTELWVKSFDHSPLAQTVLDDKLQFLKINTKFAAIMGYTVEEMSIGGHFMPLTHPDDIDKSVVVSQNLLNRVTPTISFVKRYVHKQGMDVYCLVFARAHIDEMTGQLFFTSFLIPFDDLKSGVSEAESVMQDEIFFQAFSKSHLRICLLNRQGVIRDANNSFLEGLGMKKQDLIGDKHFAELLALEDRDNIISAIYSLNQGSMLRQDVIGRMSVNGNRFWCEMSVQPLNDANGNLTHIMIDYHDMSTVLAGVGSDISIRSLEN